MSCLRFHFFEAVLRHAWLNLWVKRMTTGRINQISIEIRPKTNFQFASEEQSLQRCETFLLKGKNAWKQSFSKVFCNQTRSAHQQNVRFPKGCIHENWVRQVHSQSSFTSKKKSFQSENRNFLLAKRQLSPLENACEQ